MCIRDRPFTIINRHQIDAVFLRNINISFSRIQWGEDDYFYIMKGTEKVKINTLTFKDFYWFLMNLDLPPQPFKGRWQNILPNNAFEWNDIWENVHNNMLAYKTQSSLWMMTNLNFISAYSLNRMYNTPNVCCKCSTPEEGYAHCFLFCPVSNLVYFHFINILKRLVDIDLHIEEKAFGLTIENPNKNYKKLRNYIVSCIKCVIFRNRAKNCSGNIESQSKILIIKCKKYITSDLETKFLNYKAKKKIDNFKDLFLMSNVLGSIVSSNNAPSFVCNI